MTPLYRRIFKTQTTGATVIHELLQSMFVSEMLQPGEKIWIVSPWISNVALIDNRGGSFDSLNPEWGRREIRLVEVLIALMNRGVIVRIVTRDDSINDAFRTALANSTQEFGLEDQVSVLMHDKLHTKGILLGRCLLTGSMNLTYNGMHINDEWVEFSIDREQLARTGIDFAHHYPGTV